MSYNSILLLVSTVPFCVCVRRRGEAQEQQLFALEYRGRSQVAVRMPTGQWLSVKRSGCLAAAAAAEPSDAELFWLVLGNRPSLVLRSDFGFLGVRWDSRTGRLEGNLTAHYFWVPTLAASNAYTLRSA